jgi:tRNA threonylcarbamoyladenosine biosynthesis protein TsaB
MTPAGRILVIDTATTRAVIALGERDGTLVERRTWVAGYRHGEELLARIEGLLADLGVAPSSLGGIVVGTGPGAFTGLRVGIATAKGLAHALSLPVVGVPTAAALLGAALPAATPARGGGIAAAGIDAPFRSLVLLQPAGMTDRVLSRPGATPVILAGGTDPDLGPGEVLVAVDLDGRAPADASSLGSAAHDGLAAVMLAMGAARFAAADPDDLADLVPEYVTLPRGVLAAVPTGSVDMTGGAARP